jgi:hypothetical protein
MIAMKVGIKLLPENANMMNILARVFDPKIPFYYGNILFSFIQFLVVIHEYFRWLQESNQDMVSVPAFQQYEFLPPENLLNLKAL